MKILCPSRRLPERVVVTASPWGLTPPGHNAVTRHRLLMAKMVLRVCQPLMAKQGTQAKATKGSKTQALARDQDDSPHARTERHHGPNHQTEHQATNRCMLVSKKQRGEQIASTLDPPNKKARVLNDASPDLSMMDSIQLHPTEDEQEEFRDGEWEDEYAEPNLAETNSYQGTANSERVDSDSDYSVGEDSLNTETRNDISDLFDPCFDKKNKKWYLPSRLDSYVEKNFSEWVDPEAIKATVVDIHPTPEHDRLRVLKLDEEMLDLIPKHQRPVADKERRTQHKLLEALGPLRQAWTKVDTRKAAGKDLELAGLI